MEWWHYTRCMQLFSRRVIHCPRRSRRNGSLPTVSYSKLLLQILPQSSEWYRQFTITRNALGEKCIQQNWWPQKHSKHSDSPGKFTVRGVLPIYGGQDHLEIPLHHYISKCTYNYFSKLSYSIGKCYNKTYCKSKKRRAADHRLSCGLRCQLRFDETSLFIYSI